MARRSPRVGGGERLGPVTQLALLDTVHARIIPDFRVIPPAATGSGCYVPRRRRRPGRAADAAGGDTQALRDASIVAFAATADLARADAFYAGVLGLERIQRLPHVNVYDGHGSPLWVTLVDRPPALRTPCWAGRCPTSTARSPGWPGAAWSSPVTTASARTRWACGRRPSGSRIAWFHDPDGNTLSLHEQPAPPAPIGRDELQLAARNHGMPQEALRFPLTPTGMHYLLTHFDVPRVDRDAHRLAVDGIVRTRLSLSAEDLRRFERVELEATMECAGNGRTLIDPRAISQPWVLDAVGNAAGAASAWPT